MSIKSEALPILKPAENAYDSGELSSAAQQKSTSAIKVMPEIKENRTSKIKEEKVLLKKFIKIFYNITLSIYLAISSIYFLPRFERIVSFLVI